MSARETERLDLRPPAGEDLEGYGSLLLDERVEEWLRPDPEPPFNDADVFAKLSEDRWHWDEHGFGPWAVFEREGGALVGRVGLRWQTVGSAQEVEVGWAVRSDRWGRGYATEAAREAVEWAPELGLGALVALIMEANEASRRVAGRLGFRPAETVLHAGFEHTVFRLGLSGSRR